MLDAMIARVAMNWLITCVKKINIQLRTAMIPIVMSAIKKTEVNVDTVMVDINLMITENVRKWPLQRTVIVSIIMMDIAFNVYTDMEYIRMEVL